MWERWLLNPVLFCSSFCGRALTWAAWTSQGNSLCTFEAMSPRFCSGSGITSHVDKTMASAFVWCPKLLRWHKEAAVLLAVHLVSCFYKNNRERQHGRSLFEKLPRSLWLHLKIFISLLFNSGDCVICHKYAGGVGGKREYSGLKPVIEACPRV